MPSPTKISEVQGDAARWEKQKVVLLPEPRVAVTSKAMVPEGWMFG